MMDLFSLAHFDFFLFEILLANILFKRKKEWIWWNTENAPVYMIMYNLITKKTFIDHLKVFNKCKHTFK